MTDPRPISMLPSAKAEVIISDYAAAYRSIVEAEKEFARRSSEAKSRLNNMCLTALGEVSERMDRETRRVLASEAYWNFSDLPPTPILHGLGFNPPTGSPGDSIAVLLTDKRCTRCKGPMIVQSPRAARYGYCRDPECNGGVGSLANRGVVYFDEAGVLQWEGEADNDRG